VNNKLLLAFAFCVATSFCACRSTQNGPKLIDADGNSYFACNGALWLLNEGNPKDPGERSYYVSFKDAQGVTHELKRVRMLKVTDLPDDASACRKHQ
jgi:hypothetical protein